MSELRIFGENLVKAMEHAGLTTTQAAAKCQIPTDELKDYISGICYPDARTLGAIADALNLRVKDLAGGDPLKFTSFGDELRAMRESLGLNRKEVSVLTGVPYKSVCNYEYGESKHLTKANVEKFKEVFGGDFMTILKKYDIPEKRTCTTPGEHEVVIHKARGESEMEMAKNFADHVRSARGSLTPKMYSENIGVSRATISRMESGNYIPTLQFAEKLGFKTVLKTQRVVPKTEKNFEAAWFKYLSFIEDDAEYRKAVKALAAYVFEDADLTEIPDAKEANLIFKMIKAG